MNGMRVVDTHLHMWDDEVASYLRSDGPFGGVFAGMEFCFEKPVSARRLTHRSTGASAQVESIFVQSHTIESDYLAEVAWVEWGAAQLGIVAVVAGAKLDRGLDTITHLDALGTRPLVVGVRHDLADDEALDISTAFVRGAREVASRGWTLDLRVGASQLADIARLAGAIPDLRLMLDHLGSPDTGTADAPRHPSPEWLRDLTELATHPSVHCKLSGLPGIAGGSWTAEQVTPFLDAAADAFGVERLVWGSDWPRSAWGPAEAGDEWAPEDGSDTYQPHARQRWFDTVVTWGEGRGYDLDAILWENPRRFYRLDEVRVASAREKKRGFFSRLFGG